MSFWGFSGEHGASEIADIVECNDFWGADFDQIPVLIVFGVIVGTAWFVLQAMQYPVQVQAKKIN